MFSEPQRGNCSPSLWQTERGFWFHIVLNWNQEVPHKHPERQGSLCNPGPPQQAYNGLAKTCAKVLLFHKEVYNWYFYCIQKFVRERPWYLHGQVRWDSCSALEQYNVSRLMESAISFLENGAYRLTSQIVWFLQIFIIYIGLSVYQSVYTKIMLSCFICSVQQNSFDQCLHFICEI